MWLAREGIVAPLPPQWKPWWESPLRSWFTRLLVSAGLLCLCLWLSEQGISWQGEKNIHRYFWVLFGAVEEEGKRFHKLNEDVTILKKGFFTTLKPLGSWRPCIAVHWMWGDRVVHIFRAFESPWMRPCLCRAKVAVVFSHCFCHTARMSLVRFTISTSTTASPRGTTPVMTITERWSLRNGGSCWHVAAWKRKKRRRKTKKIRKTRRISSHRSSTL